MRQVRVLFIELSAWPLIRYYFDFKVTAVLLKAFLFKEFLARDSMLSALYAIARPSVRLSVTWVDQLKTVEVRIMQLSPQSSPMTLVFVL